MDSAQMTESESVPAARAVRSAPSSPNIVLPAVLAVPIAARNVAIVDRQPIVLTAAGLAIGVSGLVLGWGWLIAVGIAPVIVSVAPCLVMCAVCLGMMCRHNQGGAAPSASPTDAPSLASKGSASPFQETLDPRRDTLA